MYKKIILSILFILISFPVLAEDPLLKEEKVELSLTQFNMVLPASCGPTKDMETVFKKDQIVFTGLMQNNNLIEVYLNDEEGFAIIMKNVAGLSCLYFSGIPGVVREKAKKTRSKINAKYRYN